MIPTAISSNRSSYVGGFLLGIDDVIDSAGLQGTDVDDTDEVPLPLLLVLRADNDNCLCMLLIPFIGNLVQEDDPITPCSDLLKKKSQLLFVVVEGLLWEL